MLAAHKGLRYTPPQLIRSAEHLLNGSIGGRFWRVAQPLMGCHPQLIRSVDRFLACSAALYGLPSSIDSIGGPFFGV
jgi:hypothetical protein